MPHEFSAGDSIVAEHFNDNNQHLVDAITQLEVAQAALEDAQAALEERVVPTGSVMAFAGPAAAVPPGWLLCNGATVKQSDYADLFGVIGFAHGWGNGVDEFNLPDLRGRFLRGVDHGAGQDLDVIDRAAAGPGGNSGNAVGSVQGDALLHHTHHLHSHVGDNPGAAWANNMGYGLNNVAPHAITTTEIIDPPEKISEFETRPKNVYVNWIIKS